MGGDHSCHGCGRMHGMAHAPFCSRAGDDHPIVTDEDVTYNPLHHWRVRHTVDPKRIAASAPSGVRRRSGGGGSSPFWVRLTCENGSAEVFVKHASAETAERRAQAALTAALSTREQSDGR